jgi:beta-phosphoglucomutase
MRINASIYIYMCILFFMYDIKKSITHTFPGKQLKGVIFDFDGVIVDSEKHWIDLETPYLKKHIPTWSTSNYQELIGKSLTEVHRLLVEKHHFRLAREEYFKDYEDMATTLYSTKAEKLNGLVDLLAHLQEHDLRLAIASSSKRSWIDLALKVNQLEDVFEVIVSAHDKNIKKGKPAPDTYIAAMHSLGCNPWELVAIEDSKSGVQAAKAADLYCFGLSNGMNEGQDLSKADLVADGHYEILKVIKGI